MEAGGPDGGLPMGGQMLPAACGSVVQCWCDGSRDSEGGGERAVIGGAGGRMTRLSTFLLQSADEHIVFLLLLRDDLL